MRRIVLWTIGVWWLGHILLIAGHVLHVMIYAMAVAPGQEHADYEAYANASGPWFSIIFGGPVFYWLGRILRTRAAPHGRTAGLVAVSLYALTDLAILLAAGVSGMLLLWGQWIVSQTIKFVAMMLATRRPVSNSNNHGLK